MNKIENDTITIEKGTGYWDLSRYPWGGDFKRFPCDVTLKIKRVISKYANTGNPHQLIAVYNNKEVGITN